MTPAMQDTPDALPAALARFSPAERDGLRRLAQRYRLRDNGSVRPVADVAYSLRLRHKAEVSVPDVHWLLNGEGSR